MAAIDDRFQFLFQRFATSNCSKEELREFYELLDNASDNELSGFMNEYYQNLPISANAEAVDWNYMFQQITKERPVAAVKRLEWIKYVAAASIAVLLGVGGYFTLFNNKPANKVAVTPSKLPKDITAPETNRATVTLAGGQKIYLDSAGKGELTMQGRVKLLKLANGEIAYQSAGGGINENLQYNTLTNPRGSKVINIALADGSKVWLNAGSSVTYPVAFVGMERKLTITGEAYFEIAHDAAKPFHVNARGMDVQVVGTHFNVNAYDNEDAIKTTLLEGSVKVSANNSTVTIKPGEQATIRANQKLQTTDSVNIEEVMAWKNGLFQFGDAMDVKTIMRQVERWYDVNVEFRGSGTGYIGGTISRNVKLSEVLSMLEMTGVVKFQINGKNVVVITQGK